MKVNSKAEGAMVDAFLHELALMMLAETPIKSAVRQRTQSLRGEMFYRIKPENRELYNASRNALLDMARLLVNASDLEQVAVILGRIQEINNTTPQTLPANG